MPPLSSPPLWRSLAELGAQPRTAAPAAEAAGLDLDRRTFLSSLGASLATLGLSACSRPPQGQLVPYVHAPAGQTDGVPRYFATTLTRAGYGHGVLVESNMGRPTKIEGNPQHPASLGATDIFGQAAVLELWDPDRSQVVMHGADAASWDEFAAAWLALAQHLHEDGGAGLHLLTGSITSPTLAAQIAILQRRFPRSHWHTHQPAGNARAGAGAALAYGEPLSLRLHLERARVVLALDADFLGDAAAGVRYARDFAAARAPGGGARLYALESSPSLTGALADHRLPLESWRIQAFAYALAARLGLGVPAGRGELPQRWLEAVAADLAAHHGAALVVVGPSQPPWMHALGCALNEALGAVGATLTFSDPVEALPAAGAELAALATAMHGGAVDTLLALDSNPLYDAPADLDFAGAVRRVPHLLHLGLYRDETGRAAEWHLPQAHALEAWSDARAYDGTASLAQPLIAPLYGGRSACEVLAALAGDDLSEGRALVRRQWQAQLPDATAWDQALQAGLISGSAFPPRAVALRAAALAQLPPPHQESGLELLLRPDPTVGDGRWANNGWLQELPKPLTQLTWDNPALVSPALAQQLGLANGDMVELQCGTRTARAAVWITPGQAPGSVTLHLGYGRRHAGHVGDGRGFDAYALQSSADPWRAAGVRLVKTGARYGLAATQQHFGMQGRGLVQVGSAADYAHAAPAAHEAPSLYPDYPPGEYAWGMSIDLNACIGCKACTIACQAENNIPVVGKEEVRRGREMHWIRVDVYHEGTAANPRTYAQPVPCMMCEHAPCELVCPVEATVHDSEGLNVQVYNRCVGTRFCSNNCPYKVRRFNFLKYTDDAETFKAQRNPEVSVRRRGVMEKCTYCIQRIESAHIVADRAGRRLGDGEVVTACQAVCPTQAIRFGDTLDAHSAVSESKRSARNYLLLAELNTRPRTSYLARLRNPNPALEQD